MCLLCMKMTFGQYLKWICIQNSLIISIIILKMYTNKFMSLLLFVYKQTPAIVTYYLLDKFVNWFVYHRHHFWIADGIIIIYVKMYLAFCFFQISWNKSNKRLLILSFPLVFYVTIRVKGSKLVSSCNLKTCYKKWS